MANTSTTLMTLFKIRMDLLGSLLGATTPSWVVGSASAIAADACVCFVFIFSPHFCVYCIVSSTAYASCVSCSIEVRPDPV